jgi:chemotaxis protein methyltransferase CheR
VYSFKIIWNRLKSIYGKLPVLEMTATDINANYIKQAKAGIYTKSSLKEVSEEIRKFYFEIKKSGNRFDVRPFLKKNINWKVQDIFADPPEPTFHIILLRNNLLTYYQEHLKMEGLNNVIKTLAPEAWLIVGSQEKIPNQASNLIRHPSIPWAYRMEVHNGGRKIPTDG